MSVASSLAKILEDVHPGRFRDMLSKVDPEQAGEVLDKFHYLEPEHKDLLAAAIDNYKGQGFDDINSSLRNRAANYNVDADVMQNAAIPYHEPQTLKRHTIGLFDKDGEPIDLTSIKAGDFLGSKAFASHTKDLVDEHDQGLLTMLQNIDHDTLHDIGVDPNRMQGVVINTHANPGTRRLPIDDFYPADYEAEHLLMPDQYYRVKEDPIHEPFMEMSHEDESLHPTQYKKTKLNVETVHPRDLDPARMKGYLASAAGLGAGAYTLSPDDASAFPINPSEIPMEQYLQSLANRAVHDTPDTRKGFGNPNFTAPEHNKQLDIEHMPVPVGALNPDNALLRHVRENAVGATNDLSDATDSSNGLGHRFASALMGALGILGIPETSLLETPLDYVEKPDYISAKLGAYNK